MAPSFTRERQRPPAMYSAYPSLRLEKKLRSAGRLFRLQFIRRPLQPQMSRQLLESLADHVHSVGCVPAAGSHPRCERLSLPCAPCHATRCRSAYCPPRPTSCAHAHWAPATDHLRFLMPPAPTPSAHDPGASCAFHFRAATVVSRLQASAVASRCSSSGGVVCAATAVPAS